MTLDQDPRSSTTASTSRKYLGWMLVLIVIAAVVGGIYMLRHNDQAANGHKKFDPDSRPMPVLVAQAERRDIAVYQDALGTVTPRNAVVVKTRVDGQLLNLYFREGQMVKAGDLLAQIDPRPFEVQLAQANGQLARDRALLENSLIDLERYQTLLAQDSISRQQTDTQEALVRQYRGALVVDQAAVDTARLQLIYARITAPISGRIGLRQVDPGNMIQSADANGIATIAQLQPITVLFSIPEDNLPAVIQRMKSGGAVAVDAFDRGQKVKLASGRLLTTDNQMDPTTGTIKLRAEFKNDEGTLFPNQFVNIKMLVDVQKAATVVPLSALQRGRNGNYVYVVVNNEAVTLRPVKAGHVNGESIAILSGLNVGEIVVVDGADKLHDGAKVKPTTPAVADESATDKTKRQSPSKEGARQHRDAA